MPGPLMHVGALFTCPHMAPGKVESVNTRVFVNAMPVATMGDLFPIVGCTFTLPGPKPSPCVRVQWSAPSVRVKVNGLPPVLATSSGMGTSAEQLPQGLAVVGFVQPRVVAT